METQCPNCKQIYDIDDEALGQLVECPECKKEFRVETIASSSKDNKSKRSISKRVIAIIAIVIILLAGGFPVYYVCSQRSSVPHAIENRANVSYLLLGVKFKINNTDGIKTICKERAKLEYKEAEKLKIDDSFVALWCDKDVLAFFRTLVDLASKDLPMNVKREEFEKQQKKLQEILDTKHPQNKQIMGLTDTIEKEYSPLEEIILKHGYVRSLFLVEQDKKQTETEPNNLFKNTENRLTNLLYNIYCKDSEIEYPDELRVFCVDQAKHMVDIIRKDEDVASDWAKIIMSTEMKNEIEESLKKYGTTRSALYWLEDMEKQLPPIPYGCRAECFLEPKDYLSFRQDYNDIARYGEKKRKY